MNRKLVSSLISIVLFATLSGCSEPAADAVGADEAGTAPGSNVEAEPEWVGPGAGPSEFDVVHVHGTGRLRYQEPAGPKTSAGWIGTCYLERYSNRAGGWCDGNGPNWRYRGWVLCNNGSEYTGNWKWAGDRTKSFGYCPSGKVSVDGGLDVAYFN